ncbi:MAG: hypothetical protein ABIJ47_03675 [Candidatus Bathyarchaeota archaeon]
MLRKAVEDLSYLPEREYKEKTILLVIRSLLKDDPVTLAQLNEVLRKEQ